MISPGALNLCPVTAGDSPASSAPGAASPSGAPPFGQQLRDARESLNNKADAASAPGAGGQGQTSQAQSDARDASASSTDASSNPANNAPPAAPARGTDGRRAGKKDPGDGAGAGVAVAVAGLAPRPAVLPFALNFPVLSVETPNAPATDGGTAAAAGTAGTPGQPDTTEPGTSEQGTSASKAAPDPSLASTDAQPLTADLAFALKLNPQETGEAASNASDSSKNDAKDPAALPQSPSAARPAVPSQTAAAAVAPVKTTHHAEQDGDAPPAPPPQPATMARGAAATVFQGPEKGASSEPAAPAAPARPDVNKALEAEPLQTQAAMPVNKTAGPLKDLSIQVGQTQQDRVELRVVERSGELQVAVRAANPDVAQGLRQGLSELSDRLEQNGFRAEAWRPGTTTSTVQGTADTRQKSTQFQDDGSQSQSGGSRQGRQQNGQNQSSRPKWVQELEGSLTGGGTTRTGESYGVSR